MTRNFFCTVLAVMDKNWWAQRQKVHHQILRRIRKCMQNQECRPILADLREDQSFGQTWHLEALSTRRLSIALFQEHYCTSSTSWPCWRISPWFPYWLPKICCRGSFQMMFSETDTDKRTPCLWLFRQVFENLTNLELSITLGWRESVISSIKYRWVEFGTLKVILAAMFQEV